MDFDSTNKILLEKNNNCVFECYFFTRQIDPLEFTLHENYYLIKDGKAIDLSFPTSDSRENPISIIVGGKNIGEFNPEKKYERKFYDIEINKLKKKFKTRG